MLETLLLAAEKKADIFKIQPETLKNWAGEKKFKSSDFSFLNLIKTDLEINNLSDAFIQCFKLSASFSDTIQILELCTELILINSENKILQNDGTVHNWKLVLKQLRYPQTTLSDSILKEKLESLAWPYGSKIKFERRGDRAGIELKLFISSSSDLTKVISSLERVKETI
jgi:hypothetical protein